MPKLESRGLNVFRALALSAMMVSALTSCASRPEPLAQPHERLRVSLTRTANGHCLQSCPRVPRGDRLIEHTLFTLANNGDTKFADWVAYVVEPDLIGGPQRDRDWAPDPDIDETETLEFEDYDLAFAQQGYQLGHQAPLEAFSNADAWAETNYLSNITPQIGNLNGGRWRILEGAERDLAVSLQRPVFVLTGPLYERRMPRLPSADEPHRVPSGYWKILALADGRVAGFIFDNREESGTHYCDEWVELREIERRSGLDLFPRMRLNALGDLSEALGCEPA
jgi:endonuclease G